MIIDLSVSINPKTPVYPGDPAISIKTAGQLDKDGFQDHLVSISTHVGTHIDAPAHMIAGGIGLDKISIEQMAGRGIVIDSKAGIKLDDVKAADIRTGDIVVFNTGMSARYHEKDYFENYPVMTEEVANLLVAKKVKMVGVDTGSVDSKEDFPIHKTLLSGGVLIIENLTNLDELKGMKFKIYALPIKLQLDGAPARVIAETE